MRNQRLKKSVAYILTVSLIFYPLYPYADEISDAGREGQAYAKELVEGFNNATSKYNSGELTLPSLSSGVFDTNSTTAININELFPGTSGTSSTPMTDYFPAGTTPDINVLEGVSADGDDLDDTGKNFQSGLWDDAMSADPTITGAAYKVMLDMANTDKPDMSKDPALTLSRDVFNNIETISADFGDCSSTTSFADIVNTKHIPKYKTCEKIIDKSAQCEVEHIYDAGILKHHSGPYNILPLDEDSINVWIGTIGDNYWVGSCAIYEQVNEFVVVNPAAIKKVTLTYAKWDDYMQIWIGKAGLEQKVWSGPNNNFPPETAGPCELNTSWVQNPNIDITNQFLSAISEGDVVRFKIRVSVTGGGEGFARLQIDYDPAKAVFQDIWTPQNCIDATKGLIDGFATGSLFCSSIPTTAASTGCVTLNEVEICNDDLAPSPFPDIPALCEKVSVDVDYDFYKGTFCYTAANGEEVCVDSGGASTDTCAAYEADPQCGFISQKCVDGAEAADGTCYVFEEVWDCGDDVTVSDVQSETSIECAGPIRCMGADCLDPKKTQSSSFTETAALLNAAQLMTQDMNCVEINGTADVTCEVFSGNQLECKTAVGGVQDCCDVPTNTSPATYISALFQIAKLDSSLMALDNGNAVKGAYQTLREPIVKTVSNVTEPFTSHAENISGSVSEFFEPVTTFVDNLKQQIKDAIVDTVNEMVGDTAANMGTDAATSSAADAATDELAQSTGEAVVQNAGAAASYLMAAYTIYVVSVMVIQMIYECEKQEFELAAKKDTKSCHYVGSYCADEVLGLCVEKRESYCCYNSPLSRIINQQIRPQLARPFGNPKNPDCDGINVGEVANIDWSLVDLGEWTALLSQYDLMPDVNAMDLQSLTGSGSGLNVINGSRVDAGARAEQRLDEIDVDDIRREAAKNTLVDPTGGR